MGDTPEKQYGGPGIGPGWLKGGRNRCEHRDADKGLHWLQLCGMRAVYWDGHQFLCREHLPES